MDSLVHDALHTRGEKKGLTEDGDKTDPTLLERNKSNVK